MDQCSNKNPSSTAHTWKVDPNIDLEPGSIGGLGVKMYGTGLRNNS